MPTSYLLTKGINAICRTLFYGVRQMVCACVSRALRVCSGCRACRVLLHGVGDRALLRQNGTSPELETGPMPSGNPASGGGNALSPFMRLPIISPPYALSGFVP